MIPRLFRVRVGGFLERRFVERFDANSYVTLTTLGYGDITPVSAAARTFASLSNRKGW